jgi:hypothetical protein
MKVHNHSLTNMPKKTSEKQLMREASYKLLATKVLCDYVEVSSVVRGVEPEHFVEDWFTKNVIKPDKLLTRAVWRYFLEGLFEYRKNRKNK